jgi:glycosyltransferase involved in cell wall biosynthesis
VRKIVYIVTIPLTAKAFMRGHLSYMKAQGYHVTLVSSPEPELAEVAIQEGIDVVGVAISREISLFQDLKSLWQLYQILRNIKPDIVNASTPKAGFLGMLGAWFAGVPIRIYLLRGLRAETAIGLKRIVLNITERIASSCAQYVVAVSNSLSQIYLQQKLVSAAKIIMVGKGSSNGVNPDQFLPTASLLAKSDTQRKDLGLSPDNLVIGFVGRFTKDKGIIELLSAFDIVYQLLPKARLLLVGEFETGDPLPSEIVSVIQDNPNIIKTGFVNNTAIYYPLMQVFAFPSYREGFPNVPLEAALASVPTVGFQATGTVDAIDDGVTGFIVPLQDVQALAEKISELLQNPEQRMLMGENARNRAIKNFSPSQVWQNWHQFYQRILQEP